MQQQLNVVVEQLAQQQQLIAEQQAQFGQLQQQLLAALTRATQAETERTQALNLSAAAQQAAATAVTAAAAATPFSQPALVDTKALGQPPRLKRRDTLPNWPEWKHKVFTFVNAHFKRNGKRVVEAMRWAEQQRKQLLEENLYSDERVLAWSAVFSDERNSPTYFIQDASETFSALYTLLTAFTEDQAHKLVRNAGDGEGLEAWRKLSQEFDPITNMIRQNMLGLMQDPPRVEDVKF